MAAVSRLKSRSLFSLEKGTSAGAMHMERGGDWAMAMAGHFGLAAVDFDCATSEVACTEVAERAGFEVRMGTGGEPGRHVKAVWKQRFGGYRLRG